MTARELGRRLGFALIAVGLIVLIIAVASGGVR